MMANDVPCVKPPAGLSCLTKGVKISHTGLIWPISPILLFLKFAWTIAVWKVQANQKYHLLASFGNYLCLFGNFRGRIRFCFETQSAPIVLTPSSIFSIVLGPHDYIFGPPTLHISPYFISVNDLCFVLSCACLSLKVWEKFQSRVEYHGGEHHTSSSKQIFEYHGGEQADLKQADPMEADLKQAHLRTSWRASTSQEDLKESHLTTHPRFTKAELEL